MELKLNEQPAREGCEDAEKEYEHDSRNKTDHGETGGQGEHAIADNLGYHEHRYHRP